MKTYHTKLMCLLNACKVHKAISGTWLGVMNLLAITSFTTNLKKSLQMWKEIEGPILDCSLA